MSQLMIFPWLDRGEVKKVYKELFSDSIILQKHALGRIDVWASRAQHKLPVACESTAALVNANLEFHRAGPGAENDPNIVILYSMGLSRFVNHVTEKGQSRAYALPIQRLAKEVGIPEWIVDVRHSVSHGNFPSISILRAAAKWALSWLKREFWEKQIMAPCSGPGQQQEVMAALRDTLVIYQQQKFKEMSFKAAKVRKQVLEELDNIITYLGASVCPCLTEDGYFVFTEEQLNALGINESDILNSKSKEIHQSVLSFWRKVIRILNSYDIIPSLVLHLMSEVTEEASLRNKLLYGWLYTLIRCSSSSRQDLFTSPVQLPWKQILEKCFQLRGPYIQDIVSLLLESVNSDQLTERKKNHLQSLMSLYNTNTEHSTPNSQTPDVYSLQDIEPQMTQKSRWKVCKHQFDWTNCPLGKLPNQIIGYRTLELRTTEHNEIMETEISEDELEEEEECVEAANEEENTMDIDSQSETATPGQTIQPDIRPWTDETLKLLSSNIQIF